MNTKITTMMALTAILATALIFPNVGPADAAASSDKAKFAKIATKADTSDNLKPKAYGEKTKKAICYDKPCFDQTEEKKSELKIQKIKDIRKAAEHKKAIAFMKTYYGI